MSDTPSPSPEDPAARHLRAVSDAAAAWMLQKTGEGAIAAITVGDDGFVSIRMHGNASEILRMAGAICRLALTAPRATDCDACADAHDRLAQALAILSQPMGKC